MLSFQKWWLWEFAAALMSACVLIHFNVFLRPLVIGGRNVVRRWSSGLLTSGYSQSTICTRMLRNGVCRGEMLESGRYPKDGIKSFLKSSFQNWVEELAAISGRKQEGAGVEDKHEHLFFLNWSPCPWANYHTIFSSLSKDQPKVQNHKVMSPRIFLFPISFFNIRHWKEKLPR